MDGGAAIPVKKVAVGGQSFAMGDTVARLVGRNFLYRDFIACNEISDGRF